MDDIDKALLNDFQRDFPLVARPYAEIGACLSMSEDEVIEAYANLAEQKYISRIGAVIAPNQVGASTLAAMRVPEDRLAEVAEFVTSFSQVNHNYEREHDINLWFVVAADDVLEVGEVLSRIEAETDLEVLNLPIIEDYHLDLGFKLEWA
ncbi:AsnC family transcriptional regulator [Magnetovibrio blakemorei]|uniref:siroheme decarboxylase n=1 Tax=Magnetovibrio blakemorei TaxID=28181 RepID=A0A1E5Q6K4_9PROT|nr:AsnC family transcriptional regulator [Magnetovibrio blakemorei]OEJ66407.1 AsnC family transcriptional regulator [Magnetovibrio blakemorei]